MCFGKQIWGESGFFDGFVDYHSHLLPGVDDGLQNRAQFFAVLDRYAALGIQDVWLTPHIMEDIPNETAALRARFSDLQSEYTGAVSLHLGAEYMLDALFRQRLSEQDLLPVNDRFLLVETSYLHAPVDFRTILDRIFSAGYFPLLAHPERYLYMEKRDYLTLKDRGVVFQLNLPSMAGFYGERVRKRAMWLLRERMYDFSGSDTHSLRSFGRLTSCRISERCLRRLFELRDKGAMS